MCHLTYSHTGGCEASGDPTPAEMAAQLRRLWRERDWALLQAVCQATTMATYNAARYQESLGIVRTESGGWAIQLQETAILAPYPEATHPPD
jgi:hypothetical protein